MSNGRTESRPVILLRSKVCVLLFTVLILLFVRFPPFSETRNHTLLLTVALLEAGISSWRASAVTVCFLSSRQSHVRLDSTFSDQFCKSPKLAFWLSRPPHNVFDRLREHAEQTHPRSSVSATLLKHLSLHTKVPVVCLLLLAAKTRWFSPDKDPKVWFHNRCSLCGTALEKCF